MIIFLGIVGELATVIGSVVITINAGLDSILEISKNGYKIEKSVLDEIQKKQDEEEKQTSNLANKILRTILLLVPGINLINASIKYAKVKKSVMNDPQIKEAIVPMTEEEKEQYAKMEGKWQKLAFTALTASNMSETDEKVQKVIDEIEQPRIDMATKSNSESLQPPSIFEPEVIPTEELQGPRLVKTKRPQNEQK